MGPIFLLFYIVIGAIAGWIAGNLMRGGGFGLVGNIVIGIIGAFIGGVLLGLLGITLGGPVGSIIRAVLGACALLYVVGLFKRA